mmetsp:Transcript_14820/g.34054  ORF Transcript_14820/g.34054 Transcript_14820/m.34054 type:complete len:222 (-) Transcript_14820:139-804(-)
MLCKLKQIPLKISLKDKQSRTWKLARSRTFRGSIGSSYSRRRSQGCIRTPSRLAKSRFLRGMKCMTLLPPALSMSSDCSAYSSRFQATPCTCRRGIGGKLYALPQVLTLHCTHRKSFHPQTSCEEDSLRTLLGRLQAGISLAYRLRRKFRWHQRPLRTQRSRHTSLCCHWRGRGEDPSKVRLRQGERSGPTRRPLPEAAYYEKCSRGVARDLMAGWRQYRG